jgi:hypothetical protein
MSPDLLVIRPTQTLCFHAWVMLSKQINWKAAGWPYNQVTKFELETPSPVRGHKIPWVKITLWVLALILWKQKVLAYSLLFPFSLLCLHTLNTICWPATLCAVSPSWITSKFIWLLVQGLMVLVGLENWVEHCSLVSWEISFPVTWWPPTESHLPKSPPHSNSTTLGASL